MLVSPLSPTEAHSSAPESPRRSLFPVQISLAPVTRTSTFKRLVCSQSPSLDSLTASRSDECSYIRCIRGQRGETEQRAESGERSSPLIKGNGIKTPTNVFATLYSNCNRRTVTIQTNIPPFLQTIVFAGKKYRTLTAARMRTVTAIRAILFGLLVHI